MSTTLLDLPPEILTHIVLFLPPKWILACKRVNRLLYNLISGSAEVQYHLYLALAGLQDNPHCQLPTRQRLQQLRARESRWEELELKFEKTIDVPYVTSGIYDLTAGVYLLGNASRRALHYTYLPSKPGDEVEWKELKTDQIIIDMGLCVHEHDLIAVIATDQNPLHVEVPGVQASYMIRLLLNQASTGKPHPQAEQPNIAVMTTLRQRPAVGIEIVGDNLVLVLAYYENPFKPDDLVFIYEWKTGRLKMRLHAPYHSYAGLLFLTTDIILLPNTNTGTLEYWSIPKNQAQPPPTQPLLVLSLPKLNTGKSYHRISCRAEPNPTTSLRYSSKPFHSDPHHAIAIFSISISSGNPPHLHLEHQWYCGFALFIHRSSLLACLDKHSPSAGESQPVLYDEWGPPSCRWISTEAFPTRWITTTCGQRCAIIPDMGRESVKAPIILLNFNLMDVERILVQEMQDNKRAASKAEQKSKEIGQQASGTIQYEDAEWEDEENRADGQGDTPMEDIGDQIMWSHEGRSDDGSEMQSGSPLETRIEEVDAPPRPRRRVKAITHLRDSLDNDRGCFESIVYSTLPYTACSSPSTYNFDGVLLDEERVLGLQTNVFDRITTVHLLHHG